MIWWLKTASPSIYRSRSLHRPKPPAVYPNPSFLFHARRNTVPLHFLPFALSKLNCNDQSESQGFDFAFSGDDLLCNNSPGGGDGIDDVGMRSAFPYALHQQSPTKRTRGSSRAPEEIFAYFFGGVTTRNTGAGLVCKMGAWHILGLPIIVCRRCF